MRQRVGREVAMGLDRGGGGWAGPRINPADGAAPSLAPSRGFRTGMAQCATLIAPYGPCARLPLTTVNAVLSFSPPEFLAGPFRQPRPAPTSVQAVPARGRRWRNQTPYDDVPAAPLGDGNRLRELRMNFEKYTDRARGFIQAARSLALREGHQQFAPEHLLKVLLDDPEGLAAGLIDRSGGRSREALAAVEAALAKRPKVHGSVTGQLYLDPALARVFETAEKAAEKSRDAFVTVERLLLALAIAKDSEAGKILCP